MKNCNNLFPDILEIGMKHINSGISYIDLKKELERKGYKFGDTENNCKESTIENWFWDNFSHCDCKLNEEEQKKAIGENDYQHLECGCIISGNACLTYLNYLNTKHSKIYCFWATIFAVIAIVISIFF
jgi:hypothetical protein